MRYQDFTPEEIARMKSRVGEPFQIVEVIKGFELTDEQANAIRGLDYVGEFGTPQEILRERCMMGFWATLRAYF